MVIGLMSGGQASLFFVQGNQAATPAKNRDTDAGTFPATRMLIICLREEQMEVGSGMLATLSRCCTQKLEGPVQCLLGRNAEQQEC